MSSPARKRIRLSPHSFDDQVGDLSQDDIDAFDSLDAQHTQTDRIHAAFTRASAIDTTVEEPQVNYATWFNPDPSMSIGFSAATSVMPGFQRPSVTGDNAKSLFVPSAAALQEAEEKMKKWQEDLDQPPTHEVQSPSRVAFSSARIQLPETPTSAPSLKFATAEPLLRTHSSSHIIKRQTKPFKSPLISTTPSHRDYHSQSTTSLSPLRPSPLANHVTPQKPLGFTPIRGATTRPKFVTPFKVIANTSSRTSKLPSSPSGPKSLMNRIYPPSIPFSPQTNKQTTDSRLFDLTPPSGRRTLASSGLRPQRYSSQQLVDMGIDTKELNQVNLQTAPFYTFSTRLRTISNPPDPSSALVLDRSAALEELHAKGCKLAKQDWVDNHWSLVLWKLAGMVALDPTSESDPARKRWCWPEVIRQLMYRYERDLNSSSRPPLRLITTRDASAESPMILCVSDIIWPASGSQEDSTLVGTYPELELTDGWYRLRARIDAPIARSLTKRKIKIGRKIAVASAKLSAERKEGSEIMEAYGSNVLLLTGNSTHMAPWHAKLGFQRKPFIATLNSLTPDGGNVAVMMLTVIKAYPVAYIEFIEDVDGKKQRVGPHDGKEESKLSMEWKAKRELHASRLWSEYEKRRCRLLGHAEYLEQRAGSKFRPRQDDGPPDKIYDIYDTLREDPEVAKKIISTISHEEAGWLARHIHERAPQERDEVSKEIEQELESSCPTRDVKTFCVVVVSDTQTCKYPSNRTAQVTVWDIPGISISEGCIQNPFLPGERYFVTNLVPTQASAWMDRSLGGEIYLNTRKHSKWTLIN